MRPQVKAALVLVLILVVSMSVAVHEVAAETSSQAVPVSVGLGNFLNGLYNAALRVVGLAIFSMFLYAGLAKMLPGVPGNPEAIAKDAVIGLIVLVSAFVVLNSIHPNLVNVGGSVEFPIIPGSPQDVSIPGGSRSAPAKRGPFMCVGGIGWGCYGTETGLGF